MMSILPRSCPSYSLVTNLFQNYLAKLLSAESEKFIGYFKRIHSLDS